MADAICALRAIARVGFRWRERRDIYRLQRAAGLIRSDFGGYVAIPLLTPQVPIEIDERNQSDPVMDFAIVDNDKNRDQLTFVDDNDELCM